jgi:hypothetical protein
MLGLQRPDVARCNWIGCGEVTDFDKTEVQGWQKYQELDRTNGSSKCFRVLTYCPKHHRKE